MLIRIFAANDNDSNSNDDVNVGRAHERVHERAHEQALLSELGARVRCVAQVREQERVSLHTGERGPAQCGVERNKSFFS